MVLDLHGPGNLVLTGRSLLCYNSWITLIQPLTTDVHYLLSRYQVSELERATMREEYGQRKLVSQVMRVRSMKQQRQPPDKASPSGLEIDCAS